MNLSFPVRPMLCQVVVSLCSVACSQAGPGSASEVEVGQSAQALSAADPAPPTPEEVAARSKVAKNLADQTAADKKAYHKANAAALREALAVKRTILRAVEDKRGTLPASAERDTLDTELTALRASISKTETDITSSDNEAK